MEPLRSALDIIHCLPLMWWLHEIFCHTGSDFNSITCATTFIVIESGSNQVQ